MRRVVLREDLVMGRGRWTCLFESVLLVAHLSVNVVVTAVRQPPPPAISAV